MFRLPLILSVCGTFGCLVGALWANPSQQTPDASMALHNLLNARELLAKAQPVMEKCATTIPKLPAEPAKNSPQVLSELHVLLRQLGRLAEELQMQGEPAGYDYAKRLELLRTRFKQIVEAYKVSPAGTQQAAKVRQFMNQPKNVQARNEAGRKIAQLKQEQRWAEAYAFIEDALDKLVAYTVFLPTEEERSLLAAFNEPGTTIRTERNKLYRTQAQAALEPLAAAQLPNLAGLVGELTAAAGGLQTAATVPVGGQTLSGPQTLVHFGQQWRKVQLSLLRCRAIDWARRTQIPDLTYLPTIATPPRFSAEDYTRFGDDLVKGLASLIDAEAARAAGPEAAALYAAYLLAAAPLVCDAAEDKLPAALQPALEKLAAKLPALATDVQNYRAATGESLRWRERAARDQAAARADQYAPCEKLMTQATLTRDGMRGLYAQATEAAGQARLLGSCPELLTGAGPQLVGQKVIIQDVVGAGKFGVSRYRQRHCAMIAFPTVDEQVQLLKQALLVTEQLPPLSLEAAAALHAAQQGYFVSAGGVTGNVYVEGLIPRFAVLGDNPAAYALVALGALPAEPPDQGLLNHVLLRFDVTPAWVQQRHFFVDLSQPAAAK